jgi:hypothetical protein
MQSDSRLRGGLARNFYDSASIHPADRNHHVNQKLKAPHQAGAYNAEPITFCMRNIC